MNVLGIHHRGHNCGAALVTDQDVFAISEERLDGIKHSGGGLPQLSINYCLDLAGLMPKDIDLIVSCHGIPFEKYWEKDREITREAIPLKKYFDQNFKEKKFISINHHLAHAASTYFSSPFNEAAIMTIDGGGDFLNSQTGFKARETDCLYYAKDNDIYEIQKAIHTIPAAGKCFYQSCGIGNLYSWVRMYLGFAAHSEGKTMGLASYGNAENIYKEIPRELWVKKINELYYCNPRIVWPGFIAKRGIGVRNSLKYIVLDIADLLSTSKILRNDFYTKVFDEIRLSKERCTNDDVDKFDYYADVAAVVQDIIEMIFLETSRRLFNLTQSDNLCLAGGCALNGVANNKILEDGKFKNIFIQPASSDAGLPLGCSLWGHRSFSEAKHTYVMNDAYLGKEYGEIEILNALNDVKGIEFSRSEDITKDAANLISEGATLGWFQGRSEFGPRSLGARSILGDPRRKDMKDILNNKVKKREHWRPFAASVLFEHMSEYFEINCESPFMLYVPKIRPDKNLTIPALVHIDGTCRIQSVTKKNNGLFYDLIKMFYEITGVPLIINTSFNLAGNPIVETPMDALDCFLGSNLDSLVLGNYNVKKVVDIPSNRR
jgi:carbamoyltransferase